MLFLGEERMMAMLDLGGTPSLEPPTRFQECVIFHFLLTGNHPKSQDERRASLSGGAALKEFRDSSALWRPITPLQSKESERASSQIPAMSNRAWR